MTKPSQISTAEVKTLLRARFCQPEWAVFFEVGDSTGSNQRRWADAVAMNMYPSRGLEVHGFEIKVSRSDWLRELKNPAKSAPVQRFCDRWWIVCPKDIIHPGELPPTWGHYDVTQAGLRQIVAAPKLDAVPVDKSFTAALLRRSAGASEEEIQAIVQRHRDELENSFTARMKREVEHRTVKADAAIAKLVEFEKLTGLNMSSWHPTADVAKAVNMVLELGVHNTYGLFHHLAKDARRLADACEKVVGELPEGEQKVILDALR